VKESCPSLESSCITETTFKTPDLLSPISQDPVDVADETLLPSTPPTKNTTVNNPTPTPLTSFVEDGHNIFAKMFDKEQLSVEKLCTKESGKRLIAMFEVQKEARLRFAKTSSTGISLMLVQSIEFNVFKYDGTRNDKAAKRAQQRTTSKIVDAIEEAGSECLQILALHKAVAHPQIRMVVQCAGINQDASLLKFQHHNVI
jgi:hypothetical protein